MATDRVPLKQVTTLYNARRQSIPVVQRHLRPGRFPYYGDNTTPERVDDYAFDGEYILLGVMRNVMNSQECFTVLRVHGKCFIGEEFHVLEAKDPADTDYLQQILQATPALGYVQGTKQAQYLAPERVPFIRIPWPGKACRTAMVDFCLTLDSRMANLDKQIDILGRIEKLGLSEFATESSLIQQLYDANRQQRNTLGALKRGTLIAVTTGKVAAEMLFD